MTFSQHSELSMRKNSNKRLSSITTATIIALSTVHDTALAGETDLVTYSKYEIQVIARPGAPYPGYTHAIVPYFKGELLNHQCIAETPSGSRDVTIRNAHAIARYTADASGEVIIRCYLSIKAGAKDPYFAAYHSLYYGSTNSSNTRRVTITQGATTRTCDINRNDVYCSILLPAQDGQMLKARIQFADQIEFRDSAKAKAVLRYECAGDECVKVNVTIACIGEACEYLEYEKNGEAVNATTHISAGETLHARARKGAKGNVAGSMIVTATIM